MNPFISFCLYVSARVFVQYLKSRPKDTQIRSSLQFLLQAMQAIKRRNPLTESFLVQLDVDLESAGIENAGSLRLQAQNGQAQTTPNRSEGCPMEHMHLQGSSGPAGAPTYGDIGLAAYNQPNGNPDLSSTSQSVPNPTFNYTEITEMTDESMGFMSMGGTFDLPTRPSGQSPVSNSSSGLQRSPQSYSMDTSPDVSSGEHLTPGSSTGLNVPSGRTSNTGYSPTNNSNNNNFWPPVPASENMATTTLRASEPAGLTHMMGSNSNAYTDYDPLNYPASTTANETFALPSNWGTGGVGGGSLGGGTGFTPGPSTGFTPGASGMGDMLNMSDAEWSSLMENMDQFSGGWDSGLDHNENIIQRMAEFRR
jgi:hypothetical protein